MLSLATWTAIEARADVARFDLHPYRAATLNSLPKHQNGPDTGAGCTTDDDDCATSCIPAMCQRPKYLSDAAIDAVLERADLYSLDHSWRGILNMAARNGWSYRDLFSHIVAFIAVAHPMDTTRASFGASSGRGEVHSAHERLVLTVHQMANAGQLRPTSAAERWATYVLRGCDSDHDPKTLAEWARLARVSYSGLCESCRLICVQPKLARDFTRVLRVVLNAPTTADSFSAFLDVSDRRTRNGLLERGGVAVSWPPGRPPNFDYYFDRQKFVAPENCGLLALRALIGARQVA